MSGSVDEGREATGDLAPERCFVLYADRVHAILNWQLRRSMMDAIISRPLSREEEAAYRAARAAGQDERTIFQTLFPTPARHPLTLTDLQQRSKSQIMHLIMTRVGMTLPTLMKMSKLDLCRLLLGLGRRGGELRLPPTRS